jgi:hypothetical protein
METTALEIPFEAIRIRETMWAIPKILCAILKRVHEIMTAHDSLIRIPT